MVRKHDCGENGSLYRVTGMMIVGIHNSPAMRMEWRKYTEFFQSVFRMFFNDISVTTCLLCSKWMASISFA